MYLRLLLLNVSETEGLRTLILAWQTLDTKNGAINKSQLLLYIQHIFLFTDTLCIEIAG